MVNGVFKISYYLTGVDPIKNLMVNDNPISGNFCDLYFKSGYLNSYSLSFNSNAPAQVSASFSVYEKISGTFARKSSTLGDIKTLNIADFRFNETGVINDEKILALDYQYS